MKKCNKCGNRYPATEEYFYKHKDKKDGLFSHCKKCVRKYNRQPKENKELREKRECELARKALRKFLSRKEVGLKLEDLKVDKNKVYEVEIRHQRSKEYFKGRLIQNEDRFITLQKENGLIESFLKADLLRHKNIKEVN